MLAIKGVKFYSLNCHLLEHLGAKMLMKVQLSEDFGQVRELIVEETIDESRIGWRVIDSTYPPIRPLERGFFLKEMPIVNGLLSVISVPLDRNFKPDLHDVQGRAYWKSPSSDYVTGVIQIPD